MKNDQHPHSEDAGKPYDPLAIIRAQTRQADDLRLGLRAVIAIAEEAQRCTGSRDGFLERIIQRAGDALHAGQGGEE